MSNNTNQEEKKYIFDNPKNLKRLLTVFYSLCVVFFALDIFVYKHIYFDSEKWPGFYSVYGFVACVVLVLVSKYILRPLVMRKEDYYE
ncbi:MAG: hypothetical protein C0602_09300 [Denitrovibrio sp.]|nr:MAG: hypothetical protein C0602_09300 [Denitrovibrio sp.]